MRVQHVSDPDAYVGYYLDQAGGGTYYHGSRMQRGYGIGSIFGKMFRFAMPLLKRGAMHVGKALGRTGANILADAASGSNIKDSAKSHFKTMGQGLAGDAAGYVLDRVNQDKQEGGHKRFQKGGHKRKRVVKRGQSQHSHKRRKVDIFSS